MGKQELKGNRVTRVKNSACSHNGDLGATLTVKKQADGEGNNLVSMVREAILPRQSGIRLRSGPG